MPVLLTANSLDAVSKQLVEQYFEKRDEEDDFVVHKHEVLVGH